MADLELKMLREDLDSLTDVVQLMSQTVIKLDEYDEYANLTMPKPDTDEGDEFVRKELINMYSSSDERDKIPLEYVIRLVSTPSQWADFYNIYQLKNVYAIGE